MGRWRSQKTSIDLNRSCSAWLTSLEDLVLRETGLLVGKSTRTSSGRPTPHDVLKEPGDLEQVQRILSYMQSGVST